MKLRYVGESFGPEGLTNGKIYEAKEENGWYRVIDTARQKDAVLDNGVEIEQKQAVIAPQSVAVFVGKR